MGICPLLSRAGLAVQRSRGSLVLDAVGRNAEGACKGQALNMEEKGAGYLLRDGRR